MTLVGLLVAFPTVIPGPRALNSLALSAGMSATNAWAATSIATWSIQILLIFGIVRFVERRPLATLGLGSLTISDLGLGLALFTGAVLVGGLYVLTLRASFPHFMANVAPEQIKRMLALPVPVALALAVTAGFAEEIAERGFALDRIRAATGSVGIAIAGVLALSMAAHIAFWGWRYAIMVGPIELILILVYLWRGNLWPNIIAHALYDSFPAIARVAVLAALSLLGTENHHALVGQFCYTYRDYAGAVQEYSRALEAAPGDPHLLRARADAEVMNHDYAQAIADLDLAITRHSDDPDYLIQRAMAYFYAGYYQKAQAEADKAIAAAPTRWNLYEQRAEFEKWLNQPDKSIADLDQAIKLSKTRNAQLYTERGQAFLAKKDYDRALENLKEAADIGPNDTDTLDALASAYGGKKEYAQQVATLTRLLEIEPAQVDALINRAAAHLELGQRQEALDDYRRAYKLRPYDAEAANDLSWFLCTCPDAKLRDGKRALELANHACELSEWTQAWYIDTLAAAYAEQRDFDEAIVWQQRAIDLAGQSQKELSDELQKRLELYKKGLPYREEHPSR